MCAQNEMNSAVLATSASSCCIPQQLPSSSQIENLRRTRGQVPVHISESHFLNAGA